MIDQKTFLVILVQSGVDLTKKLTFEALEAHFRPKVNLYGSGRQDDN